MKLIIQLLGVLDPSTVKSIEWLNWWEMEKTMYGRIYKSMICCETSVEKLMKRKRRAIRKKKRGFIKERIFLKKQGNAIN